MLGLVAILSKWRNYQIALEEKEKGNLFLLNFRYNFPKVITFRLSLLCLYNINTHVQTKLDLGVEINSICDV